MYPAVRQIESRRLESIVPDRLSGTERINRRVTSGRANPAFIPARRLVPPLLHRTRRKYRQLSGFAQHLVYFRRVPLFSKNHLTSELLQRDGAILDERQQVPV